MFLRAFICSTLLAGISIAAEVQVPPLWTEFTSAKPGATPPLLPDFSYAGYAHGEKPIPKVEGPLFNVVDYGATPNDKTNDSEAIQKAVGDCAAHGGGVVVFPKGVFILNDDPECAEGRIRITDSHIILRGAGSGEDGTVLESPAEMQPEDPGKLWTGRAPITFAGQGVFTKAKIGVTATADRGSRVLQVTDGSGLKPGDRIQLCMYRKGEKGSSYVDPHAWDPTWLTGIRVRELHEITAVNGNRLELSEPLMIAVDGGGDWTVAKADLISEVGLEDLRIRGGWKEKFEHHRSWIDDSGWRGVTMSMCDNSWIRNCVFENMNWPIAITTSRQMTVESCQFVGTKGHFGMQAIGTYGLLALQVKDDAGHFHGPSVQSGACDTVYFQCAWSGDTSFDSHANNPYATLYDACSGGFDLGGMGGEPANYPHHLSALVFWNFNVVKPPDDLVSFWTTITESNPKTFTQVLFAGLHGAEIRLDASSVERNESPGAPVQPASLWLEQLKRRLGAIPPHFQQYATP